MKQQDNPEEKSYLLAYFLWLTLGWLGAHRFYVGRWFTGFLYACSFGFFFLGWWLDFFLLYFMVRKARTKKKKKEEIKEEEILVLEEDHLIETKEGTLEFVRQKKPVETKEEKQIAPWADRIGFLSYLQFPFRLLFFLVAPSIFVIMVIMMKQIELALLMVLILVSTGFLSSVDKILKKYPGIDKIPALGDVVGILHEIRKHYWENKPYPFMFYLFYPFLAPIAFLFSSNARAEFKLYMKIIGAIGMVLIMETVFEYSSVYPPHLQWYDALSVILLRLCLIFFFVLSFLMPTASSCFSLSLSGRRTSLFILTALGMALSVPAGIKCYLQEQTKISVLSAQILELRLKKPSFVKELNESTEMFLTYHARQKQEEKSTKELQTPLVEEENLLTEKYRRHIGGIVVNDEVNAFTIVKIYFPNQEIWLAVIYSSNSDSAALFYVADTHGNFYKAWKECPAQIKEAFSIGLWRIKEPCLIEDR